MHYQKPCSFVLKTILAWNLLTLNIHILRVTHAMYLFVPIRFLVDKLNVLLVTTEWFCGTLLLVLQVDHGFDLFVSKLCETIFTYYKSWAARYVLCLYMCRWNFKDLTFYPCWLQFCSELLDPSFLFALDNGEKYSVQPMKFSALFKMTRVKVNLWHLSIFFNYAVILLFWAGHYTCL